jgi:peptidoglycan/LPS O-acetylase OafA/YrhL
VQKESRTTLYRALLLILEILALDRRQPHWRLTTGRLVWIIRGLIALALLLAIGAYYNKGMWAWLDLLVVPAAIAVGVFLLDQEQQRRHEQDMDGVRKTKHCRLISTRCRSYSSIKNYTKRATIMIQSA